MCISRRTDKDMVYIYTYTHTHTHTHTHTYIHTHTLEYHSAIKNYEIISFAAT